MCNRRILLVSLLTLAWGLVVAAPSTATEIRLDRSFGKEGVVFPTVDPPGYQYAFLEQMTGTGTGGVYALESGYPGGCGGCADWLLTRYGPAGTPDRRFGSVPVATGQRYSRPLLTVDPRNRPVVVWDQNTEVVIRRFLPSGRPDASFGRDGKVAIECNKCSPEAVAFGPGARIVLVNEPNDQAQRRFDGSISLIARLREDGKLDHSFGGDGVVRLRLRDRSGPSNVAVNSTGALVLSGSACCGAKSLPYVIRLAANGRADRRFGNATVRALHRLRAWTDSYPEGWNRMLLRPDGRIVLLTNLDGRGVVLRLRRDGRLDRSFGRRGGRRLPWSLTDGVLDSSGGTVVVANTRRNPIVAFSLLAAGRADPASRLSLPDSGSSESISIEAQPHNRILVFDYDLQECRGNCPPQPRIYRLKVERTPSGQPRRR